MSKRDHDVERNPSTNSNSSSPAKRFFGFAVDHPVPIISILAIVTLAAVLELPRLRIAADLNLLIPRDSVYQDDLEIRERFDIRDHVIIGIIDEDGVFTVSTLAYVESILRQIEGIRGVKNVRSVFSEDNISNSENDILVIDSFLTAVSQDSVQGVVRAIEGFPAVRGILASDDFTGLALLAELDPDVDKNKVCRAIQDVVTTNPPPSGVSFHMSGLPVFEGVLGDYIIRDLAVMLPL